MANQRFQNAGLYVPESFVMDTDDINELVLRLYQNASLINHVINLKESAYYPLVEFATGQAFFPNPLLTNLTSQTPSYRNGFRTVVNFGALPNNATKTVAHNIDFKNTFIFTGRTAWATKQTIPYEAIPIPYASTIGDHVEIWVDATNVNIATISDWSAYNVCIVILEYLKF